MWRCGLWWVVYLVLPPLVFFFFWGTLFSRKLCLKNFNINSSISCIVMFPFVPDGFTEEMQQMWRLGSESPPPFLANPGKRHLLVKWCRLGERCLFATRPPNYINSFKWAESMQFEIVKQSKYITVLPVSKILIHTCVQLHSVDKRSLLLPPGSINVTNKCYYSTFILFV